MCLTKIKRNENFNYKEVNKKEVPKERIEEGGREYLNGITNHKRERLLGVHGAKAVEACLSRTAKARGYSGKLLESRLSSNKLKGILLQEVYDDITNKDGWSDMYKQKCISTVKRFYKRYGIILSDHACTRFVSQKTGKGKKHYSETDLVSIWNKNANYKESNNRLVKFQNEIAIIYNIMNNIVVSIVVRKKPKKSWEVK